MTPAEATILIVGAAVLGALLIFVVIQNRKIRWPKGQRATRTTVLGHQVIVIDAPGSESEKLLLIDACATASVSLFTAWRTWRPNDVGAETQWPMIGVRFVDDALLNLPGAWRVLGRSAALGEKPAFHVLMQSRLGNVIAPLVLVQKSCAQQIVSEGQPLMHELLQVVLNHFVPTEPGVVDGTHRAWDFVLGAAIETYKNLYSPAAVVRRRSGPPRSALGA